VSATDGALLLQCLGVRRNRAPSEPPTPTVSDWAEVLRQAADNGLGPLLYHRLTTTAPAVEMPSIVLDQLRNAAVRSAAQSLQIEADLRVVLAALRRHDVDVIVLKGAHLGQVVYQNFALRTMCDLDVLVRRQDLAKATTVLADLGYTPQYYRVEAVDYAHHHHLRPMARGDGVKVELHWTIAQPGTPFDIDLSGLWERAQTVQIAGVNALALSPEDLVLHLCLHTSFGHRYRVGLRAFWDLLEVVHHYRARLDWDVVVRRAHQWKIGRYVYLTLRLVRELLAADIPETAIAALEPPGFPPEVVAWAKTCVFTSERETSVSPSMAELWTSRRLKAKLIVLWRTLYPSRPAMARIYSTPAGSRRIYLYYLLRWPDLVLRYGRHAWGLWRGDHRTRDELRAATARSALREWLGCPVPEEHARPYARR
jgi:hypothetical protein